MRWRNRRRSKNVEDRRGIRPTGAALGGGAGIILILGLALLFGVDPSAILQQTETGGSYLGTESLPGGGPAATGSADDELAEFVSVVLADTEEVWRALFQEMGRSYIEPQLVLFSGQVRSACGMAGAAVGPFYCPADGKAYLDLVFFRELSRRFGAPGDFAQAYVIAHEIGHHVQNQLEITERVHEQRSRMSETEFNRLSVRLELQADFLAGVWAHHAQKAWQILDEGDIEEALRAASAIGDDRLQRRSQGYVLPDAFTHGTSEQRVRWFRRGLLSGDLSQGDTFNAREL